MHTERTSSSEGPEPRPLLRRLEQATIAVLLALSLVAIMFSLAIQARRHGGLIEIDSAPPVAIDFRVDINQADWPELTLLPNIGPSLAHRIVQSREQYGEFSSHEDLLRVRGIGPKTLESIRSHLQPIPDESLLADN